MSLGGRVALGRVVGEESHRDDLEIGGDGPDEGALPMLRPPGAPPWSHSRCRAAAHGRRHSRPPQSRSGHAGPRGIAAGRRVVTPECEPPDLKTHSYLWML